MNNTHKKRKQSFLMLTNVLTNQKKKTVKSLSLFHFNPTKSIIAWRLVGNAIFIQYCAKYSKDLFASPFSLTGENRLSCCSPFKQMSQWIIKFKNLSKNLNCLLLQKKNPNVIDLIQLFMNGYLRVHQEVRSIIDLLAVFFNRNFNFVRLELCEISGEVLD